MDQLLKGAILPASAALLIELHFLLVVAPLIAFSSVETRREQSLIREHLSQLSSFHDR